MIDNAIADWITRISKEGNLPSDCQAIYIGLFVSDNQYVLNFVGSKDYDADNSDWACDEEGDYFPANRYFKSGIPITEDWQRFQQTSIESLKKVRSKGNTVLSQAKYVAVGFDDGDLEHI